MSKKPNKSGGMAFRGGIPELMRQAHRMQTRLEKTKETLKEEKWTAEVAGGKVKVTINGAREFQAFEIDKELVNPSEVETLQDVILSAVNAALALADEKINAATEEATGGMRIPGMF